MSAPRLPIVHFGIGRRHWAIAAGWAPSHAIGAETQKPLAVVVIGGLLSAMLLTLLVLPTLYYWVHRRREARL